MTTMPYAPSSPPAKPTRPPGNSSRAPPGTSAVPSTVLPSIRTPSASNAVTVRAPASSVLHTPGTPGKVWSSRPMIFPLATTLAFPFAPAISSQRLSRQAW